MDGTLQKKKKQTKNKKKPKKKKHELPNQLTHFLVLDQIQRHMSYKDGTLDNNLIISILQ
jgi:hypothetical protein